MEEESQTQEHEPLFSDAEVVIIGLILLILDILDAFQFGVPVSDVLSWIIQFYEYKKGTSATLQIVAGLLELIPGADYLPIRTFAFGLLVWGDRHPDSKLAKLIKVAEVVSALKGKGGGPAGGGKAALGAKGSVAESTDAIAVEGRSRGVGSLEETAGATSESAEGTSAGSDGSEKVGGSGVKGKTSGTGQSSEESADDTQAEPRREEEKELPLEERRLENAIKGRDMEQLEEELFNPEEMLADIGAPEIGSKKARFDPEQAMNPKPARLWAANDNSPRRSTGNDNSGTKGIIDGEEVDLSQGDEKIAA